MGPCDGVNPPGEPDEGTLRKIRDEGVGSVSRGRSVSSSSKSTRSMATRLRDLRQEYKDHLVHRGLAAKSIDQYNRSLAYFLWFLDRRGRVRPDQIRPVDVTEFGAWLTAQVKPMNGVTRPGLSTTIQAVRVVCRFCRWMVETDRLLVDPTIGFKVGNPPGKRPRVLSETEVTRLIESVDGDDPRSLRDRAILEVLYSTGLRAGELVTLHLEDLDLDELDVLVRCGKGGKSRRVPVGETARVAVLAYLAAGRPLLAEEGEDRPDNHSREVPGVLWLGRYGRPLTAWILRDVVSRTAREAGLIGRVTPHTLRHTAAVHLIRGGASVRHVQLFLGHATPQTTAHYTQLVLDDLKAAWAQAHPRARMKIAGP